MRPSDHHDDPYDAVIIGAGQAGVPLARAFAAAGRRIALIEREHVGGTCINEGCTPTKAMVASARVAYLARRAAEFGVQTGPVAVDMVRVRERKRAIVDSFRGGSERKLQDADGLDLIMGEAGFTGPKTLAVAINDGGTRRVSGNLIFINTGGRPAPPEVPGLDELPVLDSTSIMELDVVPEHLLVLGGGYIGLEFGQMFRRFGSAVTIVQRGGQLVAQEDADVAEAVAGVLVEDGIRVMLNASAVRAARAPDGRLLLTVRTSGGDAARLRDEAVAGNVAPAGAETLVGKVEPAREESLAGIETPARDETLAGSHILVAAGRIPNTDRLNLAAAGVLVDKRGSIPVNERLETNVPGVYALGDVNGGPQFTHVSYDDFRVIKANLIDGRRDEPLAAAAKGEQASASRRLLPYTVFIDPQLARAGLSERQARAQGLEFRVAKMPMSHVARALEVDEARGLIKAVVDAGTGQILGCAVLGLEGGEIMAMLQVAMMGGLTYSVLRDAVFAHPTLAESMNNLFGTL